MEQGSYSNIYDLLFGPLIGLFVKIVGILLLDWIFTTKGIDPRSTSNFRYLISTLFENITVSEICKQANVSTGTFYNVFKSKYEILNRIFELADIYFTDIVQPEIINLPYQEAILKYFDFELQFLL